MSNLLRISTFFKIIAAGTLVYSCVTLELLALSFIVFGLLLIWIFVYSLQKYWISNFGFILYVLFAGLGLIFGAVDYFMVITVIFSLVAWDLDDFNKRIIITLKFQDKQKILRKHLEFLILAIILGLLTVFVSMVIDIELSFEVSLVLVVLGVVGLLLGLQFTKKQYEHLK